MIHSNMAPLAMVVTPHHLASESALTVLREGGNAIEAMVAAAATIAVVYPHMNGLGGDGFWLIIPPHDDPISIHGTGAAGSLADRNFYKDERHIPYYGPKAALTVAGTVSSWHEALTLSYEINNTPPLSISRLLRDAIRYAAHGMPVTASQEAATAMKIHQLQYQPGFASTFLPNGYIPKTGSCFVQPMLANTLYLLTKHGLDSFYRGKLANSIANEMKVLGMPIILEDLQSQRASRCKPLHLLHSKGDIWNMNLPTQGLVSLAILGITDRLNMQDANEAETIHRIVEATKKAFLLRDVYITDPHHIDINIQSLLNKSELDVLASEINDTNAEPWKAISRPGGDTVWMGIIDNSNLAVSFIQSLYHEFGSGIVLPNIGITWQNRGATFTLQEGDLLALEPRKQPFHTLNAAGARLKDGRTMIYGAMGGDGQPQTQAAIFTRHIIQSLPLQQTISAPRWLLGRHWGQSSDSLKVEDRITLKTIQHLCNCGHKIELLKNFSEIVGHAGAIIRHKNGMLEGAFDVRSNGSAVGF
ncbi:gamma-glutamyltransferase family protein [Pantoea sp. Aalb]|uniref:gamma-glutamyltransferase family protein n=1 Tax=Pantoea sp. Aalb TaxID=2576762 RepID=UPI00132CBD13|nr:gamma-glutamyltransferase [Pantoea sp. Aalb]MXP67601.1 gamma-glutamyltransferase [Pantoea sp. Aalb]